ncbi:sialate O-acetylesterase [Flavobacterium algicola]|uniref:sialate O-acetylesterase n=1 Tax=Flavobacterium algicola TaxID=556529 RepID=UPI001EFC9461|nr:sialate O-acetylesterase [Flavobacterium algicola]MCG9793709.1 sialate O-acetylesterase [Flavobacterium algicola]
MRIVFFTLFCLLSFGAISAQNGSDKIVQIVLLAGQSNMAGAGNYTALGQSVKDRVAKVQDRVLVSNSGRKPMPLSFYLAKGHKERYGFEEAFGPELMVGVTLAEKNPNTHYLLIKTAQGGTALYGAWNPEWTAEKAIEVETEGFKRELKLYSNFVNDIKENLKNLEAQDKKYKIIGMAWMQGENDAAKEVSALSYEGNLVKLITGIRTEFHVNEMPFVLGQINSHYGRFPAGPETVRTAQVQITKVLKNVAVIKTTADEPYDDFPKHSDKVHYNVLGQYRLGTAFGEKLLQMQNKK